MMATSRMHGEVKRLYEFLIAILAAMVDFGDSISVCVVSMEYSIWIQW